MSKYMCNNNWYRYILNKELPTHHIVQKGWEAYQSLIEPLSIMKDNPRYGSGDHQEYDQEYELGSDEKNLKLLKTKSRWNMPN